jgi:hypothetical protein
MGIMPKANRKDYPPEWDEVSRDIRLNRAKERCECTGECALLNPHPGPVHCVERNGPPVYANHKKRGIVLTVHHLCDCKPKCAIKVHLKAMCQHCHLLSNRARKFDLKDRAAVPQSRPYLQIPRLAVLKAALEKRGVCTECSELVAPHAKHRPKNLNWKPKRREHEICRNRDLRKG